MCHTLGQALHVCYFIYWDLGMALYLEFKLGPDSRSLTLGCNLSRLALPGFPLDLRDLQGIPMDQVIHLENAAMRCSRLQLACVFCLHSLPIHSEKYSNAYFGGKRYHTTLIRDVKPISFNFLLMQQY